MNVAGGVVGLLVGLLFLFVILSPAAIPVPILDTVLRPVAIVSWVMVLVTIYAFISSLITTGIGAALTATVAPSSVFRAYWVLSVFYLLVTAGWFIFAFLPAVAAFAAFVTVSTPVGLPLLFIFRSRLAALVLSLSVAPLHAIVTAVFYVVAGSPGTPARAELFVRGLLIGWNAAVNGVLSAVFFGVLVPPQFGAAGVFLVAIGFVAAVITLLTATTQPGWNTWNAIVRPVISWSTPFLPTAWPTVMLGWLLYFCNHVVNALIGWRSLGGFYSIRRISFWYGTHVTEGGVIGNSSLQKPPNREGDGWDLGSFAFICAMHASNLSVPPATTTRSTLGTIEHESGHNLNLGAFGTWFHLIGALDENLPPIARGTGAYAEQLAESNVTGTTATSIFMWT